MADFLTTFTAVFFALLLTKIADKIYFRYIDSHVEKGFNKIEDVASKRKEDDLI